MISEIINDIKQLSNEKKQHLGLVLVGTVVALAVIFFLVIRPANAGITKLKGDLEAAEKKYNDAAKLVRSAEVEEAKLAARETQLSAIESSMVSGDQNLWIRLTYEKFRTQAPYKVEIPNFPPPAVGNMDMIPEFPYKAATYRVSGTGFYHDLGKFLSDFENFFPFIRVLNLEITPEDEQGTLNTGDDRERLRFSFELNTLMRPTAKRN